MYKHIIQTQVDSGYYIYSSSRTDRSKIGELVSNGLGKYYFCTTVWITVYELMEITQLVKLLNHITLANVESENLEIDNYEY